ncbi:MAG TPA: hypothetical protein ENN29_07210 [Candidatus Hydrogenedentes bacterium]|nr:hypothetical protein [Candidatus Hydrogenedentota bacterium]
MSKKSNNIMNRNKTCYLIALFTAALCLAAMASETLGPPRTSEGFPLYPRPDPNERWPGDPDLAQVSDERLLQLWRDTMVAYRHANTKNGLFVSAIYHAPEYTEMPKTPDDQEYLIAALSHALDTETINWDDVRLILLLMYAGMDPDPRIPALAERMFKLPRPMKMSAAWGTAYKEMMHVLRFQQSDDAAALLYQMAGDRTFWGDDPFHTPAYDPRNTEYSIMSVRIVSLGHLSEMPPAIAIPYVERLLEAYPESYEPEELVVENTTGAKSDLTTRR